MESIQQFVSQAPVFVLVAARAGGLVLVAPVFSAKEVPTRVRASLMLVMAVAMFPAASASYKSVPSTIFQCAPLVLSEGLVGVAIGFGARIVLASFQIAGEIMGVQIGLALAKQAAPGTNLQLTIPAVILHLLAMAGFLLMDVHHWVIGALAASYGSVGEGMASVTGPLIKSICRLFTASFVDGVMAAAPCLAIMLIITFALALMAKAVPKIPILMVGYPVRVLVGIFVLATTAPIVWPVAVRGFDRLTEFLVSVARTL